VTPLVSVITATIPERAAFLEECVASVEAQTVDCWEHLVEVDDLRQGCSAMVNRAVARARGDWLFLIADDDLLLPRCLETHLAHSADADVVFAPPLVTGNEDRWWFFQAPPVIPSTALIRRSLWDDLGGYDEGLIREEDRALWVMAVAADARFVRVDEPCWVYRQHETNKSFAVAA